MFTGLIQQTGKIVGLKPADGGAQLWIDSPENWNPPLVKGESLAVSGVCLTVAGIEGQVFACDVLAETLNRTNLGAKRPGAAVNLERALRMGDFMGGHMVTGHVDGLGRLSRRISTGRDWVLRFACDQNLLRGIALKGSLAVDGVSLTVAGLTPDAFEVCIIPFTWGNTALDELREDDSVNLETDIIGKYVCRFLEAGCKPQPDPVTLEQLRQAGFGDR